MARTGPTIADSALDVIRERGPLTIDELTPLLVGLGRTRAKDPKAAVRSAVSWNNAFVQGFGGRFYALADQLEGAQFSVRPLAFELDNDILIVRDDLALLQRLLARDRWVANEDRVHLHFFGDFFDLPPWDIGVVEVDDAGELVVDPAVRFRDVIDGETSLKLLGFLEELGVRHDDDEAGLRDLIGEFELSSVLHGPEGWLPALGPRDIVGLQVVAGRVGAVRLDRRSVTGVHVEAAERRISRCIDELLDLLAADGPDPVVPLELVLAMLVTETPEVLRRPLPPIIELVSRAGFAVEDGLVGLPVEPA